MASSLFSNPMHSPLLLFLTQLALTLFLTRVLGKFFSYFKQPHVIGEIVAGILMGPSVMGRIPGFTDTIWPTELYITPNHYYDSVQTFSVIALVGLILFMFIMGMELDQGLIKAQWKSALPIAIASIVFPFGIGAAVSPWLQMVNAEGQPEDWEAPSSVAFTLFSGASMSFTAFPVLASLLLSSGLLHTPLGTQAMSCAAIDDLLAWCTLALASSFASKGGAIMGLWICLAALAYLLAMGLVVRPVLARLHAFLEARNSVENRYYICFIFMMLIASSFATEAIGIHSFFGAFVMGLIVPKSNGFADKLIPRMDLVVTEVFLPLFFASSGIKTDIGTLGTARYWGITLAIVLVATIAKFTPGCLMTKWVARQNWRFSVAMGLLMNTRGLVEIIALNVGLSMGILSKRMFTMLVIMAIITTLMTAPGMWFTLKNVRDTMPGLQPVRGARKVEPLDEEHGADTKDTNGIELQDQDQSKVHRPEIGPAAA